MIWKLVGGERLQPVAVKVGISDYANTQMVAGQLQAGDLLVTGAVTAGGNASTAKGAPKAPRPPGPGGGRPR